MPTRAQSKSIAPVHSEEYRYTGSGEPSNTKPRSHPDVLSAIGEVGLIFSLCAGLKSGYFLVFVCCDSSWKSDLIFWYLRLGCGLKSRDFLFLFDILKGGAYFFVLVSWAGFKKPTLRFVFVCRFKRRVFFGFSPVWVDLNRGCYRRFRSTRQTAHLNPLFGSDIKCRHSKMEWFQLASGKTTRRDDRSHRFSIWKRRYRPR